MILKTADNPARAVPTQDKEKAGTLSPRVPSGLSKAEVGDEVSIHLNLQPSVEEGLRPENHRLVGRPRDDMSRSAQGGREAANPQHVGECFLQGPG